MDLAFLGDSLTAGEHASRKGAGFAPLVAASLTQLAVPRERSWRLGVPGARVRDIADHGVPRILRVVVIEIGTNDWLGYTARAPWRSTLLAQFAADYRRLLRRVHAHARPRLVCLGIWGAAGAQSVGGGALDAFDAAIADESTRRGGTFVPLSDIYASAGARDRAGVRSAHGVSDGMHPNDRGHRLIAERILAAVSQDASEPLCERESMISASAATSSDRS